MKYSCFGKCVSDLTNGDQATVASLHYSARLLMHVELSVKYYTEDFDALSRCELYAFKVDREVSGLF